MPTHESASGLASLFLLGGVMLCVNLPESAVVATATYGKLPGGRLLLVKCNIYYIL